MTKGAGLPENGFVFLRIRPETITARMPTKYAAVAINALPPKNADAIRPTIGIFAPQGITQVVIIVILLLRSC